MMKCIYCGFCADLCPPGAIKISNTPTSSVDFVNNSIEVDTSQCLYCGICISVCPQHIRELTRTSMKLTNINSESWNEFLNKILDE